MSELMVF